MTKSDIAIVLLRLATTRGRSKSFCPSEAAREIDPMQWKTYLKEVRQVANKLTLEGQLICTQNGQRVNPIEVKGPIRFGLAEH